MYAQEYAANTTTTTSLNMYERKRNWRRPAKKKKNDDYHHSLICLTSSLPPPDEENDAPQVHKKKFSPVFGTRRKEAFFRQKISFRHAHFPPFFAVFSFPNGSARKTISHLGEGGREKGGGEFFLLQKVRCCLFCLTLMEELRMENPANYSSRH